MKPEKDKFLEEGVPITLMGMSGVGKTYISQMLAQDGWSFYSCDYEIGTAYLSDKIKQTLGIEEEITVDNLGLLSQFVGQIGDPSLGGLPYDEFKKRQNLYYDAECQSVLEAAKKASNNTNMIIDSTGSLCEILDDDLIEGLGKSTLFVYLEASENDKIELLNRAQEYPKPLFFPSGDFDEWLKDYLRINNISDPERMPPNDFSRWVFPKLLASRLPKYDQLAKQYGVTIPAVSFRNLKSADEFKAIIAEYLT